MKKKQNIIHGIPYSQKDYKEAIRNQTGLPWYTTSSKRMLEWVNQLHYIELCVGK